MEILRANPAWPVTQCAHSNCATLQTGLQTPKIILLSDISDVMFWPFLFLWSKGHNFRPACAHLGQCNYHCRNGSFILEPCQRAFCLSILDETLTLR